MPTLIGHLMALFFRLLYHPLAWTYDLVAWAVSLGRWKTWVRSILPMLEGKENVLELGFGPGHLQVAMINSSIRAFGLDESRQMAHIARRRLVNLGARRPGLVRGRAENMPFPEGFFDALVATFPTPYIFQDPAIAEMQRVLRPAGQLIVLLAALQPGNSLPEKIIQLLFQATGQAPPQDAKFESLLARYEPHGINVSMAWHDTPKGKLLILEGKKR